MGMAGIDDCDVSCLTAYCCTVGGERRCKNGPHTADTPASERELYGFYDKFGDAMLVSKQVHELRGRMLLAGMYLQLPQ